MVILAAERMGCPSAIRDRDLVSTSSIAVCSTTATSACFEAAYAPPPGQTAAIALAISALTVAGAIWFAFTG